MSKSRNKLNGSVESLASSLHDVISEAVKKGNESMMEEMTAMEGRLKTDINTIKSDVETLKSNVGTLKSDLETTNKNMSAQFAAQKKFISEEIDKKLRNS